MRDLYAYRLQKKDASIVLYYHVQAGEFDDVHGWVSNYDPEELDERGLTADQAFADDVSADKLLRWQATDWQDYDWGDDEPIDCFVPDRDAWRRGQ